MMGYNCSMEVLSASGSPLFRDMGCPEAAVVCGMNISWLLATASEEDVRELCQSEAEYLAAHLGPLRSPVFLPVSITYFIIFSSGLFGNFLTCAVILRYAVMETPTNLYLLSLAVSDLLVLVLGMPLEVYEMWHNYPFLFGEAGCYFKTFLFETVCFASVLNVTALSVERYLAVVRPLQVKHVTTHKHVKRVILLLWVVSMLCALPNTSLHGIMELPPRFGRHFPRSAICYVVKPTWMYNRIMVVSTLVFFFLPVLVISVLYLLIGRQLYRTVNTVDDSGSFAPGHKLSRRNLQVTKMLFVLVVVFSFCWAPFHLDRLMWSYMDVSVEQHLRVYEQVHVISGVCFYLSSAVNPVLYNLMSTRFREMFSHMTCSRQRRLRPSTDRTGPKRTVSEKTSVLSKEQHKAKEATTTWSVRHHQAS